MTILQLLEKLALVALAIGLTWFLFECAVALLDAARRKKSPK